MRTAFFALIPLTYSLSIEPFRFSTQDPFDFTDYSRDRRQIEEGSGTDAEDTQTESFNLIIPQYTCRNGIPPGLALVQSQLSNYIAGKGLIGRAVVQSVRCGSLIVDWYIEQNGQPTFVDLPGFTMTNLEEIIELFTQGEVPASTPGLRESVTLDSSSSNLLAPSMEDTTVINTTVATTTVEVSDVTESATEETETDDDSGLGGSSGPGATTTAATTTTKPSKRPDLPPKTFPAPQVKEEFKIKIPNYTCVPAGVPPPKADVTKRLDKYFKDKNIRGNVEVKSLACSSLEVEYEVTQPVESALVDMNEFTYVNLEEIVVVLTDNENFDTSNIRSQVSLDSGSAGTILSPTTTKAPRPPVLGSSTGSLATSLLLVFVITGML